MDETKNDAVQQSGTNKTLLDSGDVSQDNNPDTKSANTPSEDKAQKLYDDAANQTPKDPAKPQDDAGQKSADGEKDADKGDDDKVPESYDFKFAEGIQVDKEAVAAFTPLAKEMGLSQAKAQKLADFYGEQMGRALQAQRDEYQKVVDGWAEEVDSDKELGGANMEKTLAACRAALRTYDTNKEFEEVMNTYGLGNHPAVLRFVKRVGEASREDASIKGGASQKKSALEILYS